MGLLGGMRNGTFLELGGNDGFHTTNTRHLEHCLGWRGILIEGQPQNFKKLRANRPHSLALGVAVCRAHGFANFTNRSGVNAGIHEMMSDAHRRRFRIAKSMTLPVPCGPLGDWLALLRVTNIDFFSLDVEGAELLVLQTIDWSAISLGVLLVECTASGRYGCLGQPDTAVSSFVTARGLTRLGAFRARHDIWDLVFVNRSRVQGLGGLAAWGMR